MCVREKYKYKVAHMDNDKFVQYIDKIMTKDLKEIGFGGFGDPLLDPGLEFKLKYIKNNYPDILIFITSTCFALNEKVEKVVCQYVDTLKISNYGFSKISYESIHKGTLNFEVVMNNIERLFTRDKRPYIIMSFLMMEENKSEMEQWKNYWEKKCDEISIWKPHNWAGNYISETEQNKEKCNSCGRPGKDFVIRENGDVSVCCFDFNRDMVIGNLNDSSFEELLAGKQMKEILEMHKNKTFWQKENICVNCDQLYDRKDALVYSSNPEVKVGRRTGDRRAIVELINRKEE